MAVQHNLDDHPIWIGDTYTLTLRFKDGEVPISLEGKTLKFDLKTGIKEAPIFSYDITFPDPDVDAATGEHSVVIQTSVTSTLDIGCYYYQVRTITPAAPEDIEITYMWGKVHARDS